MVTKEDFYNITWEEYNKLVIELGDKVKNYCQTKGYIIDCIVPILRGGGVLGIQLSHMLNIVKINPCQYKYILIGNSYIPIELLELRLDGVGNKKNTCILVTEGNHCSGTTAQKCIYKIQQLLPTAIIIYVSLARDANYLKRLDGTAFEIYGILSNESKMLSDDYCKDNGIPNKFSVFPWECVEEEVNEVNSSTQNYLDKVL